MQTACISGCCMLCHPVRAVPLDYDHLLHTHWLIGAKETSSTSPFGLFHRCWPVVDGNSGDGSCTVTLVLGMAAVAGHAHTLIGHGRRWVPVFAGTSRFDCVCAQQELQWRRCSACNPQRCGL